MKKRIWKNMVATWSSFCLILLMSLSPLHNSRLSGPILFAAKETAVETTQFSDKAEVQISILETNPNNHKKSLRILIQLKMPYTRSDIDIPGSDREENYYRLSEYQKGYFEPNEPASVAQWDQTRFINSTAAWVDANVRSVKVSVAGEEKDCLIPSSTNELETQHLENAIADHENEYRAATSAGMLIREGSDSAFQTAVQEAKNLLQRTKTDPHSVTQDEIDQQRRLVNEAFAQIEPKPFDREPLNQLIRTGTTLIQNNGKDGKRYTSNTFDRFYREYLLANRLVHLDDLKSITGTLEGEPPVVHRDFTDCEKRFQEAIEQLEIEAYVPLDRTQLKQMLKKASLCEPDANQVYTQESYRLLSNAVDRGIEINDDLYVTEEELQKATQDIQDAIQALQQIPAPTHEAFDMSIRYRHQADESVSDKIDVYFTDPSGNPIEEILPQMIPGKIMRIQLKDSKLIRSFPGYKPTTFFYALDDTSTGKVKLRTDERGEAYIEFQIEKNGNLDIKYERGSDSRKDTNSDPKPSEVSKKPFHSSSIGFTHPLIPTQSKFRTSGSKDQPSRSKDSVPNTGATSTRTCSPCPARSSQIE